jgi:hypothetical protein
MGLLAMAARAQPDAVGSRVVAAVAVLVMRLHRADSTALLTAVWGCGTELLRVLAADFPLRNDGREDRLLDRSRTPRDLFR